MGGEILTASRDQLQDFTDRLTEPESRATEISHLRQFYGWALLEGFISADPSVWLVRPRLPRRIPRPMNEPDLAMAIQFAPERVRPWLLLGAYAGLRAVDMASLRANDIWWADHLIVLPDSKGGHEGAVPMAPFLEAELRESNLPRSGWLFPRMDDGKGHVPPHRISQLANRYLHSMGISETLHQTRHRFGTEAYKASGRDQRVTQELLRHASANSTARYTYVDPHDAARAVSRLPVSDALQPMLPFAP